MRQVSKDEFFAAIYAQNLDVHPSIKTSFPYTCVWEFPRQPMRKPYGKTVDRCDGGLTITDYYVSEVRP